MMCRRPGNGCFRAGNPEGPRESVDPGPLLALVGSDLVARLGYVCVAVDSQYHVERDP
jgi:hypothetical protein